MRYLINIMAIGNNQGIIWCDTDTHQMFPFAREEGNGMLPAGTQSLLKRNVLLLQDCGISDITVFGNLTPALLEEIKGLHCQAVQMEDTGFGQLIPWIHTDLIFLQASCYVHQEDINALLQHPDSVLTRPWQKQDHAFGASVSQHHISCIYAHPRAHYVNERIYPVFSLSYVYKDILIYIQKGGGRLNCGQMPDALYHPESILAYCITQGMRISSLPAKQMIVDVIFPWEILEINQDVCQSMKPQDIVDKTSSLQHCQIKEGIIQVGKHCRIENVTFEGPCIIGDHVVIEDGAVIGAHCVIQDGTTIRHACYIHDHTIIGRNNKIDFGAEIAGVTMEGVCAVHGCEVFGVIGRYVDIAAGVHMAILRFDDAQVAKRVHQTTYQTAFTNSICIGDYTRTGVNSTYAPGVHIGTCCAIGSNVLIQEDVGDNQLIVLRQELISKPWGSLRYGW